MLLHTLTIVGVGLIGGSLGRAAKKRGLAKRVVGVGRDPQRIKEAIRFGAIDEGESDLAKAASETDLMIFCTPVDRIAEQVLLAMPNCKPGAILSDAGSVKEPIVSAVEAALTGNLPFVGGHPLAGSEKKGVENADADLFVDRLVILTRTDRTLPMAIEILRTFWQALGSRVHEMGPSDHDRVLAMTSHLPHLVASVLAGVLDDRWQAFVATGFRDTTRIAAGDPEVWTPIFEQNRAAVLESLTLFEQRLSLFREALSRNQTSQVDSLLLQGKKVRDALGS